MSKKPVYTIRERGRNRGWFICLASDGTPILTLEGGHALAITLAYMNLQRENQQRADDYIAGVVAGCSHSECSKSVPTVPTLSFN